MALIETDKSKIVTKADLQICKASELSQTGGAWCVGSRADGFCNEKCAGCLFPLVVVDRAKASSKQIAVIQKPAFILVFR
jgi:hypothetical protein